MTNEEKLKIVDDACDRAFRQLEACNDFAEDGAHRLIDTIGSLNWMRQDWLMKNGAVTEPPPGIPLSALPSYTETGVDEAPDPEPEPEPSRFTKEEVRAALNVARKEKGVKIPELLAKFNVTTFTDLPESKYEAIMTELGVA